jgi:hypothetical protein
MFLAKCAATVSLGFFLFSTSPAHQQTASLHDTLIALRDSLTGVQAALGDFRRDLPRVSPETVVSRSAMLQPHCRMAVKMIPGAIAGVRSIATPPAVRESATGLLSALRELDATLRRECDQGLRPSGAGVWADSLRAWGPYRGTRVDRAIGSFEGAAGKFASAMGFKLEPRLPKR